MAKYSNRTTVANVRDSDLTPEFPGTVRPQRDGVYLIQTGYGQYFSRFFNGRWGWGTWNLGDAEHKAPRSSRFPVYTWQGLKKEPQ